MEESIIQSGFLLRNIAGSEQLLLNHIKASLDAEQLPMVTIAFTSVNVWGIRSLPAINVKSKLGCDVSGTICVMRYGRHVVVAITVVGFVTDFFQKLAVSCLGSVVMQSIHNAIKATAAELGREIVQAVLV